MFGFCSAITKQTASTGLVTALPHFLGSLHGLSHLFSVHFSDGIQEWIVVIHEDMDPHALHLKNFTYFTFFSEMQHSDNLGATVVETLVITTIFLVSAAANAGAAVLITCERRLLANKTILTLNLFVADLLFVSMIPPIVAVRWTVSWTLGCTARHTLVYVISMSGRVVITTLAAVSVERVQAILRLQTVPTLNARMVTATLIVIWAFSALTSVPLCLFFTVMEVDFPKQVRIKENSPPLTHIFLYIFGLSI